MAIELKGSYTLANKGAYIPTIDIRHYFDTDSVDSKREVVEQVRAACLEHGFFQIVGHGVPLETQRGLLKCSKTFFDLPLDEKMELSLKNCPWRRGYDGLGYQRPHEGVLPDQKEGFFIGQDLPMSEVGFLRGPNLWPKNLTESEFKDPAMTYFHEMETLGKKVWELIVVSLGHAPEILDKFIYGTTGVFTKILRYPEHDYSADKRQFGSGQHTDYGGVTILLQTPGKDGLEVWHEGTKTWMEVPAVEDKFVINLGDMIQKWTGGEYKSTIHRVINKAGSERITCATFWQGNLDATNPLLPGEHKETVSQHIYKKFYRDYSLEEDNSKERAYDGKDIVYHSKITAEVK